MYLISHFLIFLQVCENITIKINKLFVFKLTFMEKSPIFITLHCTSNEHDALSITDLLKS